jgi:plastocyanin
MRRTLLAGAFFLALAACNSGGTNPPSASCTEIQMVSTANDGFKPSPASVKKGGCVTFKNVDLTPGIRHSVQTDTTKGYVQAISASPLSSGQSSPPITLGTVGDINYICGIHNDMQGKITVTNP